MSIWSIEIKQIENLYESLKGQLPDLEKELGQLIKSEDANVILLYSRRCLEVIITDLCEYELKRPRKTEPLKGIIDKLHKEDKIPSNIVSSMYGLNDLSTYGAHPKDFDPEQVKPVLNNLAIIVKWYLKYKNVVALSKTEGEGEKGRSRDEPLKEEEIKVRKEKQEKPAKAGKRKLISIVTIVATLIIAAILVYPKIFKKDTLEKLRSSGERISVAVLPFQNMTNDTILNVWEEGIQNDLISFLSNYKELKVIQIESIKNVLQSRDFTDYTSISSSVASTISQKLDANIFIYGSIKQAGSTMRVNAQLVNSKTKEALKTIEINEPLKEGMILPIIDSLKRMVRDFLIISKLAEKVVPDYQYFASTNSPEAYNYFVYGQNAYRKGDNSTAVKMYLQAVAKDTNFIYGIIQLTLAYRNLGLYKESKEWCIRVYKKRDQMPMQQKIYTNWIYAFIFETPYDEIKYLKQFQEIDDQLPVIYYSLGRNYSLLYQYDKTILELDKALKLYDKSGSKPYFYGNYAALGSAYHKTGKYKKEKQLYEKAEQDFPDNPTIIYRQAILALSEGKSETANDYIEKYRSVLKENSATEATITSSLASIYTEAEILNKAEEYYRQALSIEPNSLERMNTLAYFLIINDRNINEGLELIDQALELSPDHYNYLHTKGWGLYKQGKYQEALEMLQKSWDLRREKAVYNHEAYLHLEEAKKAVAREKNI